MAPRVGANKKKYIAIPYSGMRLKVLPRRRERNAMIRSSAAAPLAVPDPLRLGPRVRQIDGLRVPRSSPGATLDSVPLTALRSATRMVKRIEAVDWARHVPERAIAGAHHIEKFDGREVPLPQVETRARRSLQRLIDQHRAGSTGNFGKVAGKGRVFGRDLQGAV
jgi:hypothetical protein